MIGERRGIVVGNERRTPDIKELVDNTLREMGLEVEDFRELESLSRCERGPVIA